MRSSKRFSVVYLLATLAIATAITSPALATIEDNMVSMPLLDADYIAAQWIRTEAMAFNVGQLKLTQGQSYDKVSPEVRALANTRICSFVGTMLGKINQIDIHQNNRYARCGFSVAKQRLEQIVCNGTDQLPARELDSRHNQLMRAAAEITVSGFETSPDDNKCP